MGTKKHRIPGTCLTSDVLASKSQMVLREWSQGIGFGGCPRCLQRWYLGGCNFRLCAIGTVKHSRSQQAAMNGSQARSLFEVLPFEISSSVLLYLRWCEWHECPNQ